MSVLGESTVVSAECDSCCAPAQVLRLNKRRGSKCITSLRLEVYKYRVGMSFRGQTIVIFSGQSGAA